MSKNTRDNTFRNFDVDQCNEDNFQDECIEDSNAYLINENELTSLLTSNKLVDGLKLVLSNPPVNCKDPAVKDQVFKMVCRVLLSFKSAQIEDAVAQLDEGSVDLLMKYIYRAFEQPPDNSNVLLLQWHEKAFARGKHGCIVRVLTDRKRV